MDGHYDSSLIDALLSGFILSVVRTIAREESVTRQKTRLIKIRRIHTDHNQLHMFI